MNLTSLILRWVARSSDALVGFVVELDAKLDVFLAKHDADMAKFEQDIEDIYDDAEAIAQAAHDLAKDKAAEVAKKIEDAAKAAAILKGLKEALPTGK